MRTVALFLVVALLLPLSLPAKTKSKAKRSTPQAPDAPYVSALAAANHFLRAWQTGDVETGIMLLTDPARLASTEEDLRSYFSAPRSRGFEIHLGQRVRTGRYSFPIVLLEATDERRARRRYSAIVVTSTGTNDWAVDKLP